MWYIYHGQRDAYFLYCSSHEIPIEKCSLKDKLWKDFSSVNWFYIALIFVAFSMSNVSRSLRWQMILRSMGYKTRFVNAYGSVSIAYFANLGLPRSGEFFRASFMSKYEKIGLDKTLGTIVLDRMVDMVSMLGLIALAMAIQWHIFKDFLGKYVFASMNQKFSLLIILGVASLLIVLLIFFSRSIWRQWHFVRQVGIKLSGFVSGIRAIGSLDSPYLFLLHTALVWFWYFMMLLFALKAFDATSHIGISAALLIYVFSAIGMVVPTPGGMGSYHYLMILALSFYGINELDAFSFANIAFFSAQFATNILMGIAALIYLPIVNSTTNRPST